MRRNKFKGAFYHSICYNVQSRVISFSDRYPDFLLRCEFPIRANSILKGKSAYYCYTSVVLTLKAWQKACIKSRVCRPAGKTSSSTWFIDVMKRPAYKTIGPNWYSIEVAENVKFHFGLTYRLRLLCVCIFFFHHNRTFSLQRFSYKIIMFIHSGIRFIFILIKYFLVFGGINLFYQQWFLRKLAQILRARRFVFFVLKYRIIRHVNGSPC